MSAVVKRALPLLKVLADAKPKLKKAIIQHAPTELVTAISEIVLNLIKGVIKLTASQKKRLSRYKKDLLALAKKKLSIVVLDPLLGDFSTQGAWTWRAAWTPRGFDGINFLPP